MRYRDFLHSRTERPYIVAEVGVNHEGSLRRAFQLIEQAKDGGADAVKFQTYKAGSLASRHSPAYWNTQKEPTSSQYALFRKYDSFGPDEYIACCEHASRVGIEFLSTPFDFAAVELLDPLVEAFKISSSDITNVPLLEYVAKKGKPILLSTGASTLSEISRAVECLRSYENPLCLLHCVLSYPCAPADANLRVILSLQQVFPTCLIGYSDHVPPDPSMAVATGAWLLGAKVIEKHFTYDKSLPGNDHYHAMDVDDLRTLTANIALLAQVLGRQDIGYVPAEEPARRHARRSIVARRRIPAGKRLESEDVTFKRPGWGVSPANLELLLGRVASRDIEEDEILAWDHFS